MTGTVLEELCTQPEFSLELKTLKHKCLQRDVLAVRASRPSKDFPHADTLSICGVPDRPYLQADPNLPTEVRRGQTLQQGPGMKWRLEVP
ncbi:aminopeptidase B-like isoform X2 [Meleagris gallopavo]|uniref:aminopeptidase B-like isoform X2 n=1 Tax=Meleagris gallopavo TaxID=9103 RepID=UPI00093F312B|nr:aminopeptidase B-like isoform X2 [Meleagris gallopavo]